jgi:hypothetical protein
MLGYTPSLTSGAMKALTFRSLSHWFVSSVLYSLIAGKLYLKGTVDQYNLQHRVVCVQDTAQGRDVAVMELMLLKELYQLQDLVDELKLRKLFTDAI